MGDIIHEAIILTAGFASDAVAAQLKAQELNLQASAPMCSDMNCHWSILVQTSGSKITSELADEHSSKLNKLGEWADEHSVPWVKVRYGHVSGAHVDDSYYDWDREVHRKSKELRNHCAQSECKAPNGPCWRNDDQGYYDCPSFRRDEWLR